jgi:hypothetical protein
MAKLVGVLNTSHVWIDRPAEVWDQTRQNRSLREDVPQDTLEERLEKATRILAAKNTMKDKLAELKPDVLIIFGADQNENFPSPTLRVMPPITIYAGAEFSGKRYHDQDKTIPLPEGVQPIEGQQKVPGHPDLAKALVFGLMAEGFDPAYSLELANPEVGIGHAWMNPLGYWTDYSIPTIPIVLNSIYAPCLTGSRAIALGHAMRKLIDQYPEDLRVVSIGSGGLWHTPGETDAWLNEEFDQVGIKHLEAGDIQGWAAHFDAYVVPEGDKSQAFDVPSHGASGILPLMPGPQGGTREELDWIAASSMAEGSPFTIVDVVNIYSSPIDAGFAYCDSVR